MNKKSVTQNFSVVCVSGSAGGLDAYMRLLEHLPADMEPEFIFENIGADFVDPILTGEIEATVARLDSSIKQTYPLVKRVFIPLVKRVFIEAEAWRAKDPGMQVGAGI